MTMRMHLLSGGRIRLRKSIYLPDAEKTDTIDLPVPCVLLRHPQGNVLFDTGCHPDTLTDAAARWGGMAKMMVPIGGPDDHVVAGLARLGLGAGDIDVVVNSHFHSDHCGCNEFFKRATVVCHRRELEAADAENAAQMGYVPADWRHDNVTDAIDGERDLFGDGRVTLLPLPGHTPGTMGALVSLERDGRFLLAADVVPLKATLDRDLMPRNMWNRELAAQSLAEIRRIEQGGATVVCGHDPDQWNAMKKGADAYE